MQWIYLSPHLDDVALSCAGLLWEQARAGEQVSVWTICAGDPPPGPLSPFAKSLHERWCTGPAAVSQRREEDIQSCRVMRAASRHFPVPDCIYRRGMHPGQYLYPTEEAIFAEIHPDEEDLVASLCATLLETVPQDARLVSPLALGGHVDHHLTRAAAERLGRKLWYYADYPYVLDESGWPGLFEIGKGEAHRFEISLAGLEAWVKAVGAHRSQISTFWPDHAAMQAAIESYSHEIGGMVLWEAT